MEWARHLLSLMVAAPLVIGALAATTNAPEQAAWKRIDAAGILERIKVLSSDEFEGRAPASKGETLATGYHRKSIQAGRAEAGKP